MGKIQLLDCTLRDGGYVNNWLFGSKVIKEILEKLVISRVDYIECGYLTQKKEENPDSTQFTDFNAIQRILPEPQSGQEYAVMINFGEYEIDDIPAAKVSSPIIRVCFHKKVKDEALEYCRKLIEKGYRVFVQAMAALNYSDVEFIDLIQKSNRIQPLGFYIVDSFGVMEVSNFQRLISLAEHNLDMSIILGYHSHNNLQQAYGNAKFFVQQNLRHDVVLDASVYGMGRGAGNLNMELFTAYLNREYGKKYNIDPILEIMDEYLKPIFQEHFWGYSFPFYLSAQYNCHPNYASFLSEKNTLSNRSMRQLLASLPDDVKISYSADIAQRYYQDFQKRYVDDRECVQKLKGVFSGRNILILAPGKSLTEYEREISEFIIRKNPAIIAVNVAPIGYKCGYVICTNEKRIKNLSLPDDCSLIVTSNIADNSEAEFVINYSSYLMENSAVADNPTLMLFNLLISIGVKKVSIAGFDGYSAVSRNNYFNSTLSLGASVENKLQRNKVIRAAVNELADKIKIEFITPSLYNDCKIF